MTLYNVANPAKPVSLSVISPISVGYGFDFSANLSTLFVCNNTGPYLNIIDITNPSKPTPLGQVSMGSELLAVKVSSNL